MLGRFLSQYSKKQLVGLFAEEYLGALLRYLPSYEGILLRRFFYRLVAKKMGRDALIYPQVVLTHCYGLQTGVGFAINYGGHIDARGSVTIGDYTLIGPNSFIGSSTHEIKNTQSKPRLFSGHESRPTTLGSNVWIGANCVILPGITIGDHSIVGAGSVVTKDVASSVIVAGNPAVLIRHL